ncbi:inactive serine/threonine-protein kinase TEX14-like isoform X1 [Polyodon spathula]|uniref:inactive serine/threonine-protein kinase TEX14-like isoform X1 n=1 Tax=Polyodon spathula TaxID=7913 RepID=UPI001B7F4F0C|nr:inactive serine/threonine-protein kinase TEX14-like isoform X1 [Polyodon spathula]
MARGQLGAPAWSSREERGQSSESEDMEELFYCFTGHSAATASTAQSHGSPALESLFKSFTGHQSLSDTDSEPQSINKTFNISPRVQRNTDPGKVEQSSGSDFMPDSSLEVSDEFFTPNPLAMSQEAALHSGRQAVVQTPSSEEDLEVTVEVLWPRLDSEAGGSFGLSSGSEAGATRTTVERPLDTEPNSAEVCASSSVTSFKAIGVSAEVPAAAAAEVEVGEHKEVSLTDIQDLSSIAYDGDSLSRELQQQGPEIRNTGTLVSTPRSPGAPRPAGPGSQVAGLELLLPYSRLLDSSTWSSSQSQVHAPSQPQSPGSFATACNGTASTNGHSDCSVVYSPASANTERHLAPAGIETDAPSEYKEALFPAGRSASPGYCDTGRGVTPILTPVQPCPAPEERSPLEDCLLPPASENYLSTAAALVGGDKLRSNQMSPEQPADTQDPALLSGEEGGNAASEDRGAGGPGEEQHGAALVKKGVLGAESQGGGSSSRETQDLLEETDRAHSTLDDVLQGMLADRAANENTQCAQGADRHATLTESSELAERGGEASDSASPVTTVREQDKKADSPQRAHWIQPHRVIVLEQTPMKKTRGKH